MRRIPRQGTDGEQVYTLEGAEAAYRNLLETINESALLLASDGSVVSLPLAHGLEIITRAAGELLRLSAALDERVNARTRELQEANAGLHREFAARTRLEREILEISEREQCSLGQNLHDGLGQELAGIALLAKVHSNKLASESHPEAQAADSIATLIKDTISTARDLAKGVYPVELERGGLLTALQELVNRIAKQIKIQCKLEISGPEPQFDKEAEIHIYRIVQESIGNAVKHAKPTMITVELRVKKQAQTISVINDGTGFKRPSADNLGIGLGLHLMYYRARLIGAQFDVRRPRAGGCRVTCLLRNHPQ